MELCLDNITALYHLLSEITGSISLEDAETFMTEAERLQPRMSLTDPLTFLYLSVTVDMSKRITGRYSDEETCLLINKVVSILHPVHSRQVPSDLALCTQNKLKIRLNREKQFSTHKMSSSNRSGKTSVLTQTQRLWRGLV